MSQIGQNYSALDNLSRARLNMVESQIRAGGITNAKVLEAMGTLPRENFIPTPEGALAYAEIDARLPQASTPPRYSLSPPLLARLIDAAGIHDGDLVLDMGCANGYSTAILSDLVGIGTVVGLESDEALAVQAVQQLENLGKNNVVIVNGKLVEGYPQQGPYDVILLNGASAIRPRDIESIFIPQLREHGRFVGVFDDGGDIKGVAWRWTKKKDGVVFERLFDARAPILPSFEARKTPFHFPGVQIKMPSLNRQERVSSNESPPQEVKKKWLRRKKKEKVSGTSAPSLPPALDAATGLKEKTGLPPAPEPEKKEPLTAKLAQQPSVLAQKGQRVLKSAWEKRKDFAAVSSKVSLDSKKVLQPLRNLFPKKESATALNTDPTSSEDLKEMSASKPAPTADSPPPLKNSPLVELKNAAPKKEATSSATPSATPSGKNSPSNPFELDSLARNEDKKESTAKPPFKTGLPNPPTASTAEPTNAKPTDPFAPPSSAAPKKRTTEKAPTLSSSSAASNKNPTAQPQSPLKKTPQQPSPQPGAKNKTTNNGDDQ